MTVFRGYLKGFYRKKGMVLLYLVIFLVIGTIFGLSAQNETKETFKSTRCSIVVIDEDESAFSRGLEKYLAVYHKLVDLPDDPSVLSEELYRNNIQYVLRVPEGAEESCLKEGRRLQTTVGNSARMAWYLDARVEEYVNFMKMYTKSGYSVEEAAQKTQKLSEVSGRVDFFQEEGNASNGSTLAFAFRYLPYIIISILSMVLGSVFMEYRGMDVRRRLRASSLTLMRQNTETLLAFLSVGTGLYVICMLMAWGLSPTGFWKEENLGYYAGNVYCMILVGLAIAFFIGTVIKTQEGLSGISNVLSLGLSFLGGVFVPEYMLSGGVRKLAVFLPVFWYEKSVSILDQHQKLPDNLRTTVFQGYLVQILFAGAILAVSLVLLKMRDQEEV